MGSKRAVSAVLRFDEPPVDYDGDLAQRIMVVKVLEDADEAERQAARLNELNAGKGCRYWSQVTRLVSPDVDEPVV